MHVKSFEIYTGYYFLLSSMSYTVTFSFAFWTNNEHKKNNANDNIFVSLVVYMWNGKPKSFKIDF